MKVLKHGTHYRKAVVTCDVCECEFEVSRNECDETYGIIIVNCPECVSGVVIDEKDFQDELSGKEK